MIGGGWDNGLRENIEGGEFVLFTQNRKKGEFFRHNKIHNMVTNLKAVIQIVGIEAIHAARSIVDILGRPIWWCEAGHGVVVIEL